MLVQPNYWASQSSDRSMYLPVQVLIPGSRALLSLSLCSFVTSVTLVVSLALLHYYLFGTAVSLCLSRGVIYLSHSGRDYTSE